MKTHLTLSYLKLKGINDLLCLVKYKSINGFALLLFSLLCGCGRLAVVTKLNWSLFIQICIVYWGLVTGKEFIVGTVRL